MKHVLFFAFLFSTTISYGQTKSPVYFLDSVRLTSMPHFDLNKIANMNIVGDKIYITFKNPKDFHFLTLQQIAKPSISNSTPCLFMIEDEFVKDTSGITIDSSYIWKLEILKTKEFTYLKSRPSLTILNIKLKTKSNLEKANYIHIRGKETASTSK